ncbi:bifunctional 2-C-methyl-D-erythritol 4-phosphate cytidylyltransferase/2-C-methyl-D-erythritol 2,4-cyclodiphosphate synthase [Roseiarcaceae bacterium H3SJ34-1]|uniref:bifunctional 2-C-methyl-D-erythritol 4-phosphate cytidylyltransferase/2-C-methyl-D-erythritol 2,4-cyclodiphosphate synthase n=1 Tax=Terripilifer ovatus TaxID=3032367 RepID=UPI003AB9545B|nr:bifunctional 2-C-methyl-D-erythritol 4-phosphate cytidylyltransferase/2-C-methyl-D-erythritol 2,4-cyclodiphosphate synthase [Roseiarcaceae bacterium H3SJ34-1]
MKPANMAVVLVAAGRGVRAGFETPKQYQALAGMPVATRTLDALARLLPDALIVPVIHPADQVLFDAAARRSRARNLHAAVAGGATRQVSVLAGLKVLHEEMRSDIIVLIHDVARPFLTEQIILRGLNAAAVDGASVPALPVADALKTVDAGGVLTGVIDRGSARVVQTPQIFRLGLIYDAHLRAEAAGLTDFADDAAVAAWAGHPVSTFAGDPDNVKLTTREDFALAEARLLSELSDIRMGAGFDVHAFGPGDHVVLGGISIPHGQGLAGHSDADVLLHALTDAILGALADGDIGSHFPPSDPQWRGAPSRIFLEHAMKLVRARGGMVAHLDATVICEAPKIGPHREALRRSIAAITGLDIGRVAVKATTTEKLGFTGRGEGIAVQATATLRLPAGAPA